MKKFLIQVLIFIFSLSSVIAASIIMLNNRVGKDIKLKIDAADSILLMGHSQPECAFNDSLIEGVRNFSQSGETYFYSYYKMKNILEINPNIKYILMEVSNNSVQYTMDEKIWDDVYISSKYSRYAPLIDHSGQNIIFRNNPKGYFNGLSLTMKKNIFYAAFHPDRSSSFGGYKYLVNEKSDSVINAQRNENIVMSHPDSFSQTNLAYLDKSIDLIKEKNVKIFFIRSPLHPANKGYQNEIYLQNLLKDRYSAIEYLDFSKIELNDSLFADLLHLNYKGARIFSIWFDSLLKKGLLQKVNKQQFINEEMNSFNISK